MAEKQPEQEPDEFKAKLQEVIQGYVITDGQIQLGRLIHVLDSLREVHNVLVDKSTKFLDGMKV